MAEEEDPKLTSHGHTKTATTYGTPVSENDLKTSRTGLSQLKVKRKSHIKTDRRTRDVV